MYLHLVSTQEKTSTRASITCPNHHIQDAHMERCTPTICEYPSAERAARIESLRAQVRAGTYQIDSYAIAEILLKK